MKPWIKIVDVAPREGLQNEKVIIDVSTIVALVERLVSAGVKHIEAASFVAPRWVPQMARGAEVMRRVPRVLGVRYSAPVPNLKGLEEAMAAGCDEVAVFGAASETFTQHNVNCSIRESLERFRSVIEMAEENGLPVRGYVSCVLDCPFEGRVVPARVAEVAERLWEMGCHEISLCDTIGRGTPSRTREMIVACMRRVPIEQLAGHFHDTSGMAGANIAAAVEMGIRTFDGSIGGLGGCPTRNVATEQVVSLLHSLGFDTGIDLEKLAQAGAFISTALGRRLSPRTDRATARAA